MALPPLPPNSIVNVQAFGSLNGQAIINLFQYQITNTPDPGLPYTDYLDTFNAQMDIAGELYAKYRNCMPDNWEWNFVRLQPVWPTRLRFRDYNRAVTGNVGNDASTSNIAASIERFSVLGKRHGIGRVQLPLADLTYVDGLIVDPGTLTNLNLMAVQMRAFISSAGPTGNWVPVIANTAVPNVVPRDVHGATVKTTVRVMRRRTVGLGI